MGKNGKKWEKMGKKGKKGKNWKKSEKKGENGKEREKWEKRGKWEKMGKKILPIFPLVHLVKESATPRN